MQKKKRILFITISDYHSRDGFCKRKGEKKLRKKEGKEGMVGRRKGIEVDTTCNNLLYLSPLLTCFWPIGPQTLGPSFMLLMTTVILDLGVVT